MELMFLKCFVKNGKIKKKQLFKKTFIAMKKMANIFLRHTIHVQFYTMQF